MHDTGALQILVHRVLYNQRVKRAGIGKRAAHGQRVHDGAVAIGKGNGTRFAEQTDFGHAFACATFGQSRHWVYTDNRRVAGAP